MRISKYLAYRCIHCGRWSGKELRNYHDFLRDLDYIKIIRKLRIKCKFESCNKSFKFKSSLDSRIVHKWFNHNLSMVEFIQKSNKEANKNTDFYRAHID